MMLRNKIRLGTDSKITTCRIKLVLQWINFVCISYHAALQNEIITKRTVFSEENVCPRTRLNRKFVKIDYIYSKLKITIYLYVSLVKIHPFLNEIGC